MAGLPSLLLISLTIHDYSLPYLTTCSYHTYLTTPYRTRSFTMPPYLTPLPCLIPPLVIPTLPSLSLFTILLFLYSLHYPACLMSYHIFLYNTRYPLPYQISLTISDIPYHLTSLTIYLIRLPYLISLTISDIPYHI